MIRSKIPMGFLWTLLALALHVWPGAVVPTHGQGTRKDDIVFNSRGIPLAGATVRVCAMPATGQPCAPLALIYSDAALTQAIANPTTTDGLGNYFFYAAPGKYEIEISGPSITTKQIPNIVLPNDPSSPTFSGAISAFSLNLSGNLSVTGNTTVIGSLASGTLNLANQSTPPGAAGAGTVNLYTKTTDKRLYYKDETGTEIGPIASASGAQTNIVNTFTATQNFDADVETKGPNPNFSFARYGGYSSTTSTPPSTTGTISSGSSTLTLASAQDFANGQGIVVYKAGPATGLTTPGTPTVTPINLLNGATTYNYRAVAEDRSGGLTAAGTAGSTTTGAATLGANTVTLTSCVRISGVATYTSSSNHNLQAGAQISIAGFTGGVFDSCNGVKTIAATPTGTTFTTNDGTVPNETNTTGSPTATVYACNTLTFPSGSFSGSNTIHYWIYRSVGAGAFSLVGVAQGLDPWWQDCALPAPAVPSYVPGTPPGSAQPGYLATTITSGGGTTTLTLANAAGTTATSQTVLHDNSVPLKNAVQATNSAGGGTVYIPNGGAAPWWVFNAVTDFSTLTLGGSERIHVNSSGVFLNQPWIAHAFMDFEGEPHSSTSFSYVNGSAISGLTAYPLFILSEINSADAVHFSRLTLSAGQSQQAAILTDEGQDGGGVAGIVFDDVNFLANGVNTPVVLKGGFDFFFNRGDCNSNSNIFEPFSCLQLTNASPAVTGSGPGQVPGRVKVNGLYFAGNAVDIDCLPDGVSVAPVDFTFNTTIFESATAPYIRFNCPTGVFGGIALNDVVQADTLVGYGTPSIDAQNDGSLGSVSWTGGAVGNAASPALITSSASASLLLTNAPFVNPGNTVYAVASGGGLNSNGLVSASGNGAIQYAMPITAAPGAVVSAGGSVPIGTIPYQVQFLDVNGNPGPVSPAANVTTTSGNQTVTVTIPTPPNGSISWFPYRNGARLNIGFCTTPIPISTTTFVDTFSFVCGSSTSGASGGTTILSNGGFSGSGFRLVNNGNVLSTSFPNNLTSNHALSIPDVTGYLPTTSYLNSGYDNATRANGAIGANWTVTNVNGINISSNNFLGTGSNSVAYWSASPFSPVQFSQVTLTALNGTTDFPGVAVLLSGSGSGTQGYNCVEDTTNNLIQKISGTTNATITSASSTGAAGDILRLEAAPGGALTCYKNGVSTLTTTDSTYTTGSPGLFLFGSVSTAKNWSGGNLHPLAQPDVEADWTKGQHLIGNYATCSMSSSTSCTVTLSTSSLWKACNAQVQGSTAIAAACNISGTTLTVTAASSNSQVWGIFLY